MSRCDGIPNERKEPQRDSPWDLMEWFETWIQPSRTWLWRMLISRSIALAILFGSGLPPTRPHSPPPLDRKVDYAGMFNRSLPNTATDATVPSARRGG